MPFVTERLYTGSPIITPHDARFTAAVVHVATRDTHTSVVLDRTQFFPTGGGQPCDTGLLRAPDGSELEVIEALEDGDRVLHVCANPTTLAPGDLVSGEVNVVRRRDHMEQHSGQHVLSAVLLKRGVETLSFHLGNDVTIDVPELTGPVKLDASLLHDVELEVNQVIRDCLPVVATTHSGEDAVSAAEGLRKPPGEDAIASPHGLRIVRIGPADAPIDRDPCCGTHVDHTGRLGLLSILGTERGRKGELRISFAVGGRAVVALRARLDALAKASTTLTTGFAELPQRGQKLLAQTKALSRELKRARERATVLEAAALARETSDPVYTHVLTEGDPAQLRAFARAYLEVRESSVLALAHAGERLTLAIARGISAPDVDCGTIVREVLAQVGGKGGGNRAFAQGSAPDPKQVDAVLAATRARLGP